MFTVDAPARLRLPLSGDWNGDGNTDLAALSGQTLWMFQGDGNGGFNATLELWLGVSPGQIAAVDLNSDGRTDLLAHQCIDEGYGRCSVSEFSAFLSEGNFRFGSPLRYRPRLSTDVPPGGPNILGFSVADLNRDDIPDLLLTLSSIGRESVVLGRGDGTFAHPIPGPYTFNLVGVADFDSDGNQDVMTLGLYATRPQIYYGRGDGSFEDSIAVNVCPTACWAQVADVDSDDKPDLLVGDASWSWTGNLRLFRGNGRVGFSLAARPPDNIAGDEREGYTLAFADLNGDKIPDLYRVRNWSMDDGADNVFGAYTGNGSGEFAAAVAIRLPYLGQSHLVDVNRDGKPDLIASDAGQNIFVFLNSSR